MSDLEQFADGMRAYRRGDYPAAVGALAGPAEREDLPGKLARYYCAMGRRAMGVECIRAGRFADAAEHLRQAIALVGNRADLIEYLLAVYARTGRYGLCADKAEILSGLRPDDSAVRVRQAQAQWRSGRRPLAVMTLTRALRELGDRAELHMNLGLFYAAEEDYDRADDHLRRAVECDCASAAAHRYLGLVASAKGDFHSAAEAFGRACNLDASDLVLTYQLCLAADAAARTHQPITLTLPEFNRPPAGAGPMRQLAEYVTAEPDFIETFLALPPSDADEELFGVMMSVLRTALAYHDGYADLHYYAGVASARLGDLDAAAAHTARAVGINPRYAKALIHLAEIDARRGRTAEAVGYLRRAVQAGADFPDVHARLGELLAERGMVEPARKHYSRALELKPHYRPADEGMASLAA